MFGVYTQRVDPGLGRLSAGFLGAGLLYGGLCAIFLLQDRPLPVEEAKEQIPVLFRLPPAPLPPPPAGGGAAAAHSSAQPEITPKKSNLAPKVTPRETKEAIPKPPETETPATADLSGMDSLFGEEGGHKDGVPGGVKDGIPGGDLNGSPWGVPGTPPGGKGGNLPPDEGGPIPLKPGMDQPKKIAERCPPPEYPAAAREASITGTVAIKVTVTREGKVKDPVVLEGPAILQEAALASVKQCAYEPALFNGYPVAVTMLVRIKFSLH